MMDRKTPQSPKPGIAMGAIVGLGIGAIFLAAKAWPPVWPGLLLPASLSLFCFVWVWVLFSRMHRPLTLIAGLAFGVLAAHLALWLPFVFASYLDGQGARGLAFSLGAALVTGMAVGWYVLTDHPWVTLGLVAGLGGLRALATWYDVKGQGKV